MTNVEPLQLEVQVNPWGSALQQLCTASDLAPEVVQAAALKGAVWHRKSGSQKLRRIRELEGTTAASDTVFLNYNERVLAEQPLQPTLIEDLGNYSIWIKPAGMLSQGSKWSDHCCITQTVSVRSGKPAYLVHRLDKAASGLMVVAHTRNALQKLAAMFANRQVDKQYEVLVHGEFDKSMPFIIDTPVEDKQALSEVLSAQYESEKNASTILVRIETGRKHQIRAHLSSLGFPVVGDRLFDATREHTLDLQLRACKLSFTCPFSNKLMTFEK